jgi:chromosome partitioning protein
VRTARIVAVANQKGGVGKSTTAVSLGAALADAGHQVLVIDLDPQGNASTGLGIRHESREVTVYDVLVSDADITKAVIATPVASLFAIPSTIDLAGAEIELVSQFSRELRLRRALDPLRVGVFDFILLDCPPSLGLLTINALAAAEELMVPIQCEYYALEGLGQLLRNVRLVQQNVNPGLRLSGIVMTMFDPRTKLSEQVVQEVRKYFGELVYETVIPRTVRLSEAPGFGQPITVYDPRSRGAASYRSLADEVSTRPVAEGPLPLFEEMPTVEVEPVAPAPEPTARSAPRPLREAVAEELERAEREESEPSKGPEPSEPQASLTEPSSELGLEDGVGPSVGSPAEAETSSRGTAARSQPQPEVEPAPAEGLAADASEAEAPAPPRAEGKGRAPVVIDAYDLDPDAGSNPEVEGNGNESDVDDGQRKRWSLFRRGGRR